MLLIDSPVITTADIVALVHDALDIANVHGVVLEGDDSVIARAWESLSVRIAQMTQSIYGPGSADAVLVDLTRSRDGARVRTEQVVVTTQLRRFLAILAAEELLRRAVARTAGGQGDRYQAKLDSLAEEKRDRLIAMRSRGFAAVAQPLPAPAARYGPRSGSWALSAVAGVGGVTAAVSYEVRLTYVDQRNGYVDYSRRGNGESEGSESKAVTLQPGELARVDISGLVPPVSDNGLYRSATGWQVWARAVGDADFVRQHAAPLPITTTAVDFGPLVSLGVLQPGQDYEFTAPARNLAVLA